jgi:hypothetical protein
MFSTLKPVMVKKSIEVQISSGICILFRQKKNSLHSALKPVKAISSTKVSWISNSKRYFIMTLMTLLLTI